MGGWTERLAWPPHRVDPLNHHNSHIHLLSAEPTADAPAADVDAMVVPAGRPVGWLEPAIALARQLDCVLLVLCSHDVSAAEVATRADAREVRVVAIDIDRCPAVLPAMSATMLLARVGLARESDASDKRNTALVVARLVGWKRILFLDDDIVDVDPAGVRTAAGLLDCCYQVVGLANNGYPDNSVVCHAYRQLGGDQAQFIGAGGLAVAPMRTSSMFPNIYNQDWLFLIGDNGPMRVATAGVMSQKEFDPFADPQRAAGEEFGDCISEGLYWLLDEGRPVADADADFWQEFLGHRRAFLLQLARRAGSQALGSRRRRRQLACLRAARAANDKITPELCVEYIARWQADLVTWRAYIDQLPTGLSLDEAFAELGLTALTTPALDGCGRAEGHAPAH